MTTEATPQARYNKEGSLCPSWCVTDHAKYNFHASEIARTEAPQYHSCVVRALDYGNERSHRLVSISAAGMFDLAPGAAEDLANLIEQLATATPEEHRQLAGLIRQHAAIAASA